MVVIWQGLKLLKDRANLSTYKFFVFERCWCIIVLVLFLVIFGYQNSFLCDFVKKWHFWLNLISYSIFAIFVGGASLGLTTAFRLIAVSGARLSLVDVLVVRCIKVPHHVKSAIKIYLQFISNMFTGYTCIPTRRGSAPVFWLTKKLRHQGFILTRLT